MWIFLLRKRHYLELASPVLFFDENGENPAIFGKIEKHPLGFGNDVPIVSHVDKALVGVSLEYPNDYRPFHLFELGDI